LLSCIGPGICRRKKKHLLFRKSKQERPRHGYRAKSKIQGKVEMTEASRKCLLWKEEGEAAGNGEKGFKVNR